MQAQQTFDFTAQLTEAYQLMIDGAFNEAESRLEALPRSAATPQTLIALARTKLAILAQLARDVRFQAAWEQKRSQLLSTLDEVERIAQGSQEAVEAQSIRMQLQKACVSKPATGCAMLVLFLAAALVTFAFVAIH